MKLNNFMTSKIIKRKNGLGIIHSKSILLTNNWTPLNDNDLY